MQQREKILTIIVAVFVGALMVYYVFGAVFLGPLREWDQKIASIRADIEKNGKVLRNKNLHIREWRSVSRQALNEDPDKANRILSERVTALIAAAGLRDVTKTPVPITPAKAGSVVMYTPVAINLSGKGTLAQIVKFLELFYQEPYNVKIKGFTLRPEGGGDLMSFSNFRVESIIPAAPLIGKIEAVTSRPIIAGDQPPVKTDFKSQYAMIPERNIFRPYSPPPVQSTPKPQPPVARNEPRQPARPPAIETPADPNGRPGDVVATIAVGKQLAAYIRNPTGPALYKVEDKLSNGMTMTFVHPLGIVITDGQGKTLYVELGRNIDQPAPLTAEAMPELYEAWKQQKRP